jgi:hypothetical protein
MKKTVFVWLLLLSIVFSLNSCNGAATEPAPEAPPELSKEELHIISQEMSSFFEKQQGVRHVTVSQLESAKVRFEEVLKGREELGMPQIAIEEYYTEIYAQEAIASIPDNEVYHPATVVHSLKEEFFINEVQTVLGQPHFNVYATSEQQAYDKSGYDLFTFYLLNNGRVLELHFVPVYIGEYDRAELQERIPHFDHYESYNKEGQFLQWEKLLEATVLTTEELYTRSYTKETLKADKSRMPAPVSFESLEEIREGMTYEEVKRFVGHGGVDVGADQYVWDYVSSETGKVKEYRVRFRRTESGELIVSKIDT